VKKINQLIWYDYTKSGPNYSFWVDARDGKVSAGAGKPAENPDLIMSVSADDAHRSWSNKLNPLIAIARKQIRVKGNATNLLKLIPKLKVVAEIYN
jgi:putative sterol carrier protein